MVRKPDKDADDIEEPLVPCVFCDLPGPETELQCFNCQNLIPFDIATGERDCACARNQRRSGVLGTREAEGGLCVCARCDTRVHVRVCVCWLQASACC